MMQDHEPTWVADYLGDTYPETTVEQRAALIAADAAVRARYPHEDLADQRERALSAAAQVILGDTTLEESAAEWRAAYQAAAVRHDALTGALIASEGSDVSLAERAGVTRMTVRKALGK